MPGAGTDKTKNWVEEPGPIVVLVEPQLGENIGSAARAMANFGLGRLRLVKPREGWPNPQATKMASGADRVLDRAEVFDTLEAAIADCTLVFATTARAHDQAKPVVDAVAAAAEIAPHVAAGDHVAILFGRERYGLENDEVGLADRIITFPVNPAFASLNLAQAVLLVAYEWFKHLKTGALPFAMPQKSPQASKHQLQGFFDTIERELERVEWFRPAHKRGVMQVNLRNIFNRMQATQQDIRTLHGIVMAIAEGRKGPAKGGVLDDGEAGKLRSFIAQGREPGERTPPRGLARLLRRNPTDAERVLWEALTRDKRFAGRGFKRQVPIGVHIVDFVSFPLRVAIELVPAGESEAAGAARAARRAWLVERDYQVVEIGAGEIDTDVAAALRRVETAMALKPNQA